MAWNDPDHRAKLEKARYWRNPDVRLRTINRARYAQGYPLRASLDEIDQCRAGRRGGA